jgi:hypothetical protein
LGSEKNLHVKINVDLELNTSYQLIELLKELKDIFAWTYKDLKGIPPNITQHQIALDTLIPPIHQARYQLNPNYATIVKQDIDKLLVASFIKHVEEATWLSPIVVVLKKNGKFRIFVDFKKFNAATKKEPYMLPFTYEVINIVAGHEVYTFFDGFFGYHQISIAPKDQYKIAFVTDWGVFVWVVMPFGVKNGPPTYQRATAKTFHEYIVHENIFK